MSNEFKDIGIKNHTRYFYDDIINAKNLDPNSIKIGGKSYKNILIYYFRYVNIKNSKYIKMNSANPL